MMPVSDVARASVRHGVVGLGILTALPAVLVVRAAVGRPTADHTPGEARHTPGDATRAGPEKAQGDRQVHRRSRRATGRRPAPEMVIPECTHRPACPPADAPDRDAARVVVTHPDQGWSLLCNGVVLFDDLGAILPDGGVAGTGRQQVALLRRYGSRRHRTTLPRAA